MIELPRGVRSRQVDDVNGLSMHLLEAGDPADPCIMLLHGFPDLAYGWRHVMPELARLDYYVIAPDQRGYGQTTGWHGAYDDDLRPFGMQSLATDLVALILKLGIEEIHCLAGHDFGSPVAAYLSLFRPDLINRLVLMSAPFPGAPKPEVSPLDLDVGLGELQPPRRHYQAYNSGPTANQDMLNCPQGLKRFLRGYFHMKSADWLHNEPKPLAGWRAEYLSEMPHYYVMPAEQTMPEVVAPHTPDKAPDWLNDDELEVFVEAFRTTEFQGALNWYRASSDPVLRAELGVLCGKTITTPTWYLAGAADWGTYQTPGALERMQRRACQDFRRVISIANAGHWVQQEQPALTAKHLLAISEAELVSF